MTPLSKQGLEAAYKAAEVIDGDTVTLQPNLIEAAISAYLSTQVDGLEVDTWTAECFSGRFTGMIKHKAGAYVLKSDALALQQANEAQREQIERLTKEKDEALENAKSARLLLEYAEDSIGKLTVKWNFQIDRAEAAEAGVAELEKERDEAQATAYRSQQQAVVVQQAVSEASERAAKNWRDFRDLRIAITGDGPMCRDCADFDGRCQGDGRPCDPDEEVSEQIATWKAAEARLKQAEDVLKRIAGNETNTAFGMWPTKGALLARTFLENSNGQ